MPFISFLKAYFHIFFNYAEIILFWNVKVTGKITKGGVSTETGAISPWPLRSKGRLTCKSSTVPAYQQAKQKRTVNAFNTFRKKSIKGFAE